LLTRAVQLRRRRQEAGRQAAGGREDYEGDGTVMKEKEGEERRAGL
jgi:hypothetical protein